MHVHVVIYIHSTSELYEMANCVLVIIEGKVNTCGIVYAILKKMSFIDEKFMNLNDTHGIATRSSVKEELSVPHSKREICKGKIIIRGAKYYYDVQSTSGSCQHLSASTL